MARSVRLYLIFLLAGAVAMTAIAGAEEKAAAKAEPAFGDAVQLAPFVVNGKKLSISVYARTKSDRKYGEEFAEQVVGIAYETLGKSTGNGLVIVGREGEPHPVVVVRKFLAMAAAGSLDPTVAAKASEINARMTTWKEMFRLDEAPEEKKSGEETSGEKKPEEKKPQAKEPEKKQFKLSFDMLMPALPLPLEGWASKLYQLSWAENFDDARIEQKLRALTPAGLESDALSKYDWVFYLPPRNAFAPVMDDIMKQGMKAEKMGLFKRAAVRSALVLFRPAVKTAVEAMRKGALFMTVLRAESNYGGEDLMALTYAYTNVLMPDFKFNGGTEHKRALEAIEAQKVRNAEFAKNPYVSPPRLATFDPAAYAPFEGDYSRGKDAKNIATLRRKDYAYCWPYRENDASPRLFYPAGDRLLVSADGKMTLELKVDDQGAVTGLEEQAHRHRRMFPRKVKVAPEQTGSGPR